MKRWLFAVLAACLCALCAPAAAQGVNRALLVGCDRFLTQQDTSPASAGNVEQMAGALSGGAMNLEVMTTRRSGVGSVRELMSLIGETFAGADEGDVSYFYFSTHGVWEAGEPGGEMAFLLSDGRREESVTAQELRDAFDAVPGTKVLILDACHAGAVLGKGVHAPFGNVFCSPEYKVICSSGGAEESWFWAGADTDNERAAGAGYFSGTLVRGISASGAFAADGDLDGVITLTELKRYLRMNHGASTVQTYPEEDGFAVLSYDPSYHNTVSRRPLIRAVSFEAGTLSAAAPAVSFSFTVLRPIRVAYQLVYQRDGRWDFDNATVLYDSGEAAEGRPEGWLSPGWKQRTVTLDTSRTEDYGFGYVLLQVVAVPERGSITVAGSTVLCIPPASGDPAPAVELPERFRPSAGEEMTFVVAHAFPCEMTVNILDAEGRVVRRLARSEPTRPGQLAPTGTSLTWNGRLQDGTEAPPGEYRVQAVCEIGEQRYACVSAPCALE